MPTIFSRIIAGELPAHIIAEEEQHIAFLDIHPLVLGHTLVVPKQEVVTLFDLADDALGSLLIFAKRVARSLAEVVPCQRVATLTLGLEVPHVHFHLLPINSEKELQLRAAKPVANHEMLATLAARLRSISC